MKWKTCEWVHSLSDCTATHSLSGWPPLLGQAQADLSQTNVSTKCSIHRANRHNHLSLKETKQESVSCPEESKKISTKTHITNVYLPQRVMGKKCIFRGRSHCSWLGNLRNASKERWHWCWGMSTFTVEKRGVLKTLPASSNSNTSQDGRPSHPAEGNWALGQTGKTKARQSPKHQARKLYLCCTGEGRS